MKKLVAAILIIVAIVLVFLFSSRNEVSRETQVETKPEIETAEDQKIVSDYYYPLSGYKNRIKLKSFGTYVTAKDVQKEVCGKAFVGYHTGDDLEVTGVEQGQNVPVKAVAAGTVVSVGPTSGYGGLVVVRHQLGVNKVTAYYGHLNLSSVHVKAGQAVRPGQVIGNLGQACSIQTDFERKHLHFALHKGTAVDVRGYVPYSSQLSAWLDPLNELVKLKAI